MPLLPSVNAGTKGALVPIGYQTFNGSQAVAAFSNIPQIYQDLMIVAYMRSSASTAHDTIFVTINGSTATASATILGGDGSSSASTRQVNNPQYCAIGVVPGATSTSGIFGSTTIHALNYTNTSAYKTFLSRSAEDINGAGNVQLRTGLIQTTSAITSISVVINALVNPAAGSTLALYGIRTVGQ